MAHVCFFPPPSVWHLTFSPLAKVDGRKASSSGCGVEASVGSAQAFSYRCSAGNEGMTPINHPTGGFLGDLFLGSIPYPTSTGVLRALLRPGGALCLLHQQRAPLLRPLAASRGAALPDRRRGRRGPFAFARCACVAALFFLRPSGCLATGKPGEAQQPARGEMACATCAWRFSFAVRCLPLVGTPVVLRFIEEAKLGALLFWVCRHIFEVVRPEGKKRKSKPAPWSFLHHWEPLTYLCMFETSPGASTLAKGYNKGTLKFSTWGVPIFNSNLPRI